MVMQVTVAKRDLFLTSLYDMVECGSLVWVSTVEGMSVKWRLSQSLSSSNLWSGFRNLPLLWLQWITVSREKI